MWRSGRWCCGFSSQLQGHPWGSLRQGDSELVPGTEGALIPQGASHFLCMSWLGQWGPRSPGDLSTVTARTVSVKQSPTMLRPDERQVWSLWRKLALDISVSKELSTDFCRDVLTRHGCSLFFLSASTSLTALERQIAVGFSGEQVTPVTCCFAQSPLFCWFNHLFKSFSKSVQTT